MRNAPRIPTKAIIFEGEVKVEILVSLKIVGGRKKSCADHETSLAGKPSESQKAGTEISCVCVRSRFASRVNGEPSATCAD